MTKAFEFALTSLCLALVACASNAPPEPPREVRNWWEIFPCFAEGGSLDAIPPPWDGGLFTGEELDVLANLYTQVALPMLENYNFLNDGPREVALVLVAPNNYEEFPSEEFLARVAVVGITARAPIEGKPNEVICRLAFQGWESADSARVMADVSRGSGVQHPARAVRTATGWKVCPFRARVQSN